MALQLYKIATVEVGSAGASTIDFTSIPSGYTDLCLKVNARNTNTNNEMSIKFNGSATSYSARVLYGTGSAAGSYTGGSTAMDGTASEPSNYTANTFANSEIYIPNYAGATNKSVSIDGVQENNATAAIAQLAAGLWSNTAAINQITLTAAFAQYSTATLYGIL